MRFRLDMLTNIGPLEISTALFTPDISIESYSKRISAPGKMVFHIRTTHPKATDENLRMFRRVRLYRQVGTGYIPCWFGYIEDKSEFGKEIEVICTGMLGFFTKRFTGLDQSFTGEGSADAFSLLEACNTDSDTGVTEGDGDVDSTKNVQAQGRIDVLKAWQLLADAHGAEFEIDDEGEFHFVQSLGSTLTIHLVYRRDGSSGNTVSVIRIGESGRDMATRVIGTTSADGVDPYIYNSPTQATYGVITEVKAFNEAKDSGTLQSMVEAYGSQRENPLPDFEVTPVGVHKELNQRTGEPELRGLDYFDVQVGALVPTQIITENRAQTTAKRIVEIMVRVDENGHEHMTFTLSNAGIHITADYLDASRTEEMNRRLRYLESVVS